MPTLTVKFLGLCLIVVKKHPRGGAPEVRVLLPDARKPHGFKFRDGTHAGEAHSAALLEERNGRCVILTLLDEPTEIRFPRGTTSAPVAMQINEVVPIHEMAQGLEVDENAPRLASVTLPSGELVAQPALEVMWYLPQLHPQSGAPGPQAVATSVTWSVEFNNTLEVELAGEKERDSFEFTSDITLCLVNVCCEKVEKALNRRPRRKTSPGEYTPDHDFKWYFQLLKDTFSADELEKRARKTRFGLPVPTSFVRPNGSKTQQSEDTPTCLIGRFEQ